jgi:hypothetical protein
MQTVIQLRRVNLQAQPTLVLCLCIFLLALVPRLALLWLTRSYLEPNPSEVVSIAESLATDGQFANVFGPHSGPTAHTSPLYPLLLSAIFRVFGTGEAGQIAQETCNCMMASLLWCLMPLVSRVCGTDRRVGVLAGVGGAVLPINRVAETKGAFETTLIGLSLVVLFAVHIRYWRNRDFSVRSTLILGAVGGLAALVSPLLAVVMVGLLLVGLAVVRCGPRGHQLCLALGVVLTMMAVMFPWALRNYFELGAFVWTRSNLGIELNVSNNDLAVPNAVDNGRAMAMYHPHANQAQLEEVSRLGEVNYNRQKRDQALRWIGFHPRGFLRLTLLRIFYTWFPKTTRPLQTLAFAALTLVAVPGLLVLGRHDRFVAFSFVSVLLLYPSIYYIIQTSTRYVYPIEWILYYLGAYWLWYGTPEKIRHVLARALGTRAANEHPSKDPEIPVLSALCTVKLLPGGRHGGGRLTLTQIADQV